MFVEKFTAKTDDRLSKIILSEFTELSYNSLMKIFRQKDIKVNGKRCGTDQDVFFGDEIIFYHSEEFSAKLDIIFEDNNILIINKPKKLETVSETESDTALARAKKYLKSDCFAVHRLDRNTTGLLVFAKNNDAKQSLDRAFKNRTIDKFYYALVCGKIINDSQTLVAYLKKDKEKAMVKISEKAKVGYEKIETQYSLISQNENFSLLSVKLVTGKTHQIRAHLAFIGYPILGDEKYGDSNINSKYKIKYQCLCSNKIIFNFDKQDYLGYLDGKVIKLPETKIDFLNKS